MSRLASGAIKCCVVEELADQDFSNATLMGMLEFLAVEAVEAVEMLESVILDRGEVYKGIPLSKTRWV